MAEQATHKVKSADRVLDILELFTGDTEAYNLTEISRQLSMPSSSAYVILQNMLNRGYLETDRTGKLFRIGYKLFMIRNRYAQGTSLSGEFYAMAEKIHADVNETVSLSIRNGNALHYIAEKVSTHSLRFTTNLDIELPLHATASGKILLAKLTMEELMAIYPDEDLLQVTGNTIAKRTDLIAALEQVRVDGVAYNLGETVEGVHCVATGIYDREEHAVAAISLSVPTPRLTDEIWDRVHYWIHRASTEMSSRLYG